LEGDDIYISAIPLKAGKTSARGILTPVVL